MDKADSRAKRGAMNDLHISQRHGNKLGMLGETAQPVCHHTPHDRSYINPFHLREDGKVHFHSNGELDRRKLTAPSALSTPVPSPGCKMCKCHNGQAFAPATSARGDSCSLWLWTCEQHFLGEAFKASPAAQSYLLSIPMFWREPDLCTQLAPFNHDAFRVIIPCFPRVLV